MDISGFLSVPVISSMGKGWYIGTYGKMENPRNSSPLVKPISTAEKKNRSAITGRGPKFCQRLSRTLRVTGEGASSPVVFENSIELATI